MRAAGCKSVNGVRELVVDSGVVASQSWYVQQERRIAGRKGRNRQLEAVYNREDTWDVGRRLKAVSDKQNCNEENN
jgi:hypothetical protein